MVVEREEPLEEEQGQQPERRPADGLRRSDPHGLGDHVEESRAQHRAGGKTQVDLESGVVEHHRQREDPAEDADDHDGRAERGERDRDGHRTTPAGPGARPLWMTIRLEIIMI